MFLKNYNLKNKTAVVTGAGKGLGRACAIALAEAGAKVIIISRTLSDLDKVEKIIKKTSKDNTTTINLLEQLASIKTPAGKITVLAINAAKVAQAKQLNHLKSLEVSFIPSDVRVPKNLDKNVASDVTRIA